MHQFNFEAIGTKWQINIYPDISSKNLEKVYQQIQERISDFDLAYSRFRADSLVSKMAEETGSYSLPPDAEKMIQLYADLYRLTKGSFTPLIGQLVSDAGYDATYSLKTKSLTAPEKWEDVISYSKSKLIIKKPVLLDFGAGGKGYLIDLVGAVLKSNQINSFCIDAGGDILFCVIPEDSVPALKVGLENPDNLDQVIGVAHIQNQSICGSAGNRRKWGEFHHIMNPHTLSSPKHIAATWVVADETLVADSLATALFFAPGKLLSEHYTFEYAVLFSDSTLESSQNFPAEFFFEGGK